jgi:hypothetical protein
MTQLLDVYVFSRTKWLIRNEMMRGSVRQNESVPGVGDWIDACSRGARQAIVETDWSDKFVRLGLDLDLSQLRPEIDRALHDIEVLPKLPTAADLAFLMGQTSMTDRMRTKHCLLMKPALELKDSPHEAPRWRTADVPVPANVTPASVANRRMGELVVTWRAHLFALDREDLEKRTDALDYMAARNVFLKFAEPPDRVGPSAGTRSRNVMAVPGMSRRRVRPPVI